MAVEAVLAALSICFAVLLVWTIICWYKVRWTYGADRGMWNARETPEGRFHYRRLLVLTMVTWGIGGGLMVFLPNAG